MKIIIRSAILLIIAFALLLPGCGSSSKTLKGSDSSIVQIWQKDPDTGKSELAGTGLSVGNGSQILTVFNYVGYSIDNSFEVVWPGHGKYPAAVAAIDPRNSVTLLEINGVKIPVAPIGNAGSIQTGGHILIKGWHDFGQGPVFQSDEQDFPGFGTILVVKPNSFAAEGDVATDQQGNVIGIVGTLYNEFVVRLGVPGMTAPIININDALQLLSQDVNNQPWSKGPVDAIITTQGTLSGYAPPAQPPPANYNEMTDDIQALFDTMGGSLPAGELPKDYRSFSWGDLATTDGILLSVLYPRLFALHDSNDNLVATTKWVGIQWGRSEGKPNRIFYGSIQQGNCVTEGGFLLNGDISSLATDIGIPLVTDYSSLTINLKAAGAAVETGDTVSERFFSVPGKILKVNGSPVEVFEYPSNEAMEAEAATVSPDGSDIRGATVGASVDWVASPHFYKKGKILAIYVGDYQSIADIMESVMGKQFAGLPSPQAGFGVYLTDTGELVFADSDVKYFYKSGDPLTNTFELNENGIARWNSFQIYDSIPKLNKSLYLREFVIKIDGKEICHGTFWSSASSAIASGFVILESIGKLDNTNNKVWLESAYPAPDKGSADNAVYSRISQFFATQNKLKP